LICGDEVRRIDLHPSSICDDEVRRIDSHPKREVRVKDGAPEFGL
jgi:hypothetical protein